MESFSNLNTYFIEELRDLECQAEVRAYIVSVLSKFKYADDDLSNKSITIEYGRARENWDFARFQKVGDWIFFSYTLFPESLNGASKNYYRSLAQMSYFSCYRVINWQAYEQLADQFEYLSDRTRKIIHKF